MDDATSKILSFKILPFELQFDLVDPHRERAIAGARNRFFMSKSKFNRVFELITTNSLRGSLGTLTDSQCTQTCAVLIKIYVPINCSRCHESF